MRKIKLSLQLILVCVGLGAGPSIATAPVGAPPSKAQVAAYARQLLEQSYRADGPGAAALVARGDEVLFRGARGRADVEHGKPLSPNGGFEIGSMTKQFVAAGVLKLVEAGRVSLDDPLSKYVKDYPGGDGITILELLDHTSGIKDYTEVPGRLAESKRATQMTTAQMIDSFKSEKVDFAPGTKWAYSNSGYVLLGAVIEEVTGQPWYAYLKRTLFQPFGLTHTGYGADPAIAATLVHGYSLSNGKRLPAVLMNLTQVHAAGALVSNVDDLLKWNRALHEGNVLQPQSYRQMITPVGAAVDGHYGFGIIHGTLRGAEMLEHGGDIFGFNSFLTYLPETRLTVAVLYNVDAEQSSDIDAKTIAKELAAYAIGKPYPEKKAIAVSPAMLKAYEGVYRIDDKTTRTLRVVDGSLTSRRSGRPRYRLIAIATDEFLFDAVLSRIKFVRDGAGAVSAMRLFDDDEGEGKIAVRTSEPLPPDHVAVALPRPAIERVTGTYLGTGIELVVFAEAQGLKARVAGQPAADLLAESPDKFYVPAADATLVFAPGKGRPQAAILSQGGEVVELKRKPD